jgi:hypothetical protein
LGSLYWHPSTQTSWPSLWRSISHLWRLLLLIVIMDDGRKYIHNYRVYLQLINWSLSVDQPSYNI